jgi:enamine deaminase RidA (YjgF/YER057c/UK114 family)
MEKRTNIFSGTVWEDRVGYARAVRVGNIIEVSGTTAVDGETLVGKDDAYIQAQFIFRKIGKALNDAGASLQDVVRTRMFVTDIGQWEKIAKAHEEVFKNIRPCATMVQVEALIAKDLLVEIEVTAIVANE